MFFKNCQVFIDYRRNESYIVMNVWHCQKCYVHTPVHALLCLPSNFSENVTYFADYFWSIYQGFIGPNCTLTGQLSNVQLLSEGGALAINIIIAFVKERFHNAVEIDILGIF